MLDMAYIRVLEVATFYTQFQLKPVGTRAHVQVCGTTPCMLRGSESADGCLPQEDPPRSAAHQRKRHAFLERSGMSGRLRQRAMVIIFKDAYEDLTPERLEEIIDTFEAGKGDTVKTGPQIDRHQSVPVGGLTTLTEEIKPDRSNLD